MRRQKAKLVRHQEQNSPHTQLDPMLEAPIEAFVEDIAAITLSCMTPTQQKQTFLSFYCK